jgi:hypothetical protein
MRLPIDRYADRMRLKRFLRIPNLQKRESARTHDLRQLHVGSRTADGDDQRAAPSIEGFIVSHEVHGADFVALEDFLDLF